MRELALHLLDIIQNSVKAGARRIEVLVEAEPGINRLRLRVSDNGYGMAPELLARVTDPFVTTRKTRSVGLGIPLLKEQCEQTGGSLAIESAVGQGTVLTADLGLDSIDRLPLGELGETWQVLVQANPEIDYRLSLLSPGRRYDLDLADIRRQMADVPLNEPAVLDWIRFNIEEQQDIIFGGVLHEIISRTGSHPAESQG